MRQSSALWFNAHMDEALRRLLKQTSRSFYLSMRILPAAVRPQMALAYLLARSTDTVADTRGLPVQRRREALRGMRAAILCAAGGRSGSPPELTDVPLSGYSGERMLMRSFVGLLDFLRELPVDDRYLIGEVLTTITSGQELDVARFGDACEQRIAALENDEELDDYVYRVAGCVGEFWTRMCRAHLFPKATLGDAMLLVHGVRFGKGLQLINILRDLANDLRRGRCYIPKARLEEWGLSPHALLDPKTRNALRPLLELYMSKTEGFLADGWTYVRALPRSQARVRLACIWPLVIGRRTLELLRAGNVLDPAIRIRVSRHEIRLLMLLSLRHILR